MYIREYIKRVVEILIHNNISSDYFDTFVILRFISRDGPSVPIVLQLDQGLRQEC